MGEALRAVPRLDVFYDLQQHLARELGGDPGDYYHGKTETREACVKLGLGAEYDRLKTHLLEMAPLVERSVSRAANNEAAVELGAPSEDRMALDLVERHGDALRYVPSLGWFVWDGRVWRPDRATSLYQITRGMLRASVGGTKAEKSTLSASYVAGVERLARTDERIVVMPEMLDADPLILNTPAGIVDLKTGEVAPNDPARLCTKVTAVAPDTSHGPLLLDQFLTDITQGDVALRQYLQRFLGYCATGLTLEDVLAFWYGPGANGKTTLAEAVAFVLQDYACAFSPEVLMESRGDRHPTDLAQFQSVRFAFTSEPASSATWNDSRVKALTGDSTITARRMRQDFYTFPRTHKTLVLGNSQPTLTEVNHAIRRRVQMVPFRAVFTQTPGPGMRERLKTEAAGALLAWIVMGARDWTAQGTNPPELVTEATSDYLSDQDVVGQWLETRCTRDPDVTTTLADLYRDYKAWCDDQGHRAKSNKAFSAALVSLGFRKSHGMAGRTFAGLQLPPMPL